MFFPIASLKLNVVFVSLFQSLLNPLIDIFASHHPLKVNIDAQLVKKSGAKLSQVEEKLVEMQNGCICCTLREDLLVEIAKLGTEGKFDYILIESSGISEPMPVAETFTFDIPLPGDEKRTLSDVARLDTMVTVVDANTFNKDLHSIESLAQRYGEESVPEEDIRSVANLLSDQVRKSLVMAHKAGNHILLSLLHNSVLHLRSSIFLCFVLGLQLYLALNSKDLQVHENGSEKKR